MTQLESWYDFSGQVAVITGGTGVLLSHAVRTLGEQGATLVLLSTSMERAQRKAAELEAIGIKAFPYQADVLDKPRLDQVAAEVMERFGHIDILLNGAGGNRPAAIATPQQPFFGLSAEAMHHVFDLNFMGAFYCCQAFGEPMAEQGRGVMLNVASMVSIRPLTRVVAYSAAKAALTNFTQWLAVHLATTYGTGLRVNAIAPGFLLGEQNRALLVDQATGELTPRGAQILAHTPLGRFGNPEEMTGGIVWLLSSASAFVTGVVLPLDGGYSAFGGV
jgi:NAD(P)-dependent dehydrogenase (short-subunit alcohol dehydrogenase family)